MLVTNKNSCYEFYYEFLPDERAEIIVRILKRKRLLFKPGYIKVEYF